MANIGGVAFLPSDFEVMPELATPENISLMQTSLPGGGSTGNTLLDQNLTGLRGSISGLTNMSASIENLASTAASLGGGSTTNNAAATAPAAATGIAASVSDYFIRGVVIILGFIFVAIGLSMFRSGDNIVETVAKHVPTSA